MNIYNTLTHKIEKFVPNEPGKVSMYTCRSYSLSLCPYRQSEKLYNGGRFGKVSPL